MWSYLRARAGRGGERNVGRAGWGNNRPGRPQLVRRRRLVRQRAGGWEGVADGIDGHAIDGHRSLVLTRAVVIVAVVVVAIVAVAVVVRAAVCGSVRRALARSRAVRAPSVRSRWRCGGGEAYPRPLRRLFFFLRFFFFSSTGGAAAAAWAAVPLLGTIRKPGSGELAALPASLFSDCVAPVKPSAYASGCTSPDGRRPRGRGRVR